jgi:hypothetical protein
MANDRHDAFHSFDHKNRRLTQKQFNSFKDADADASFDRRWRRSALWAAMVEPP